MHESVARVLELAFTEIGFMKIEAWVLPGNTASLRLLEEFGFSRDKEREMHDTVKSHLGSMTIHSLSTNNYRPPR
jgi:RimJ/RimL family protein N-acetyltransferase